MHDAMQPTRDPGWVLTHEGYNVLTENAVESRFALGNGFLGMRASRPVSRGPTWVSWLGYIRWASWPRCYVAGLFDRPNTVPPVPALVPVADWSRVRLVLDDNPQLLLDGEFLASVRQLDLRRGVLLSDLSYRAHAGITISGGELRLVSLADRAVALQLLRFSLDRDGIDVTLEANFAMAGMGMEPLQLDRDVCAWRTEGSGKAVAMAGSATLRADGHPLVAGAVVLAALDLALAFRCRTGARTRPSRHGGAFGQLGGRPGPGCRRCAGAQPRAWLARGAGSARDRVAAALGRERRRHRG